MIMAGVVERCGSKGTAWFSADRRYRYALVRQVSEKPGTAVMLGCNPSKADENTGDPTAARGIGFTERLGFGRFCMLNMAAGVSTDPKGLLAMRDPIGPRNLDVVALWLRDPSTKIVIAAWGGLPLQLGMGEALGRLQALLVGREVFALGLTQDGHPRHPSRLGYNTPLVRWAVQ